MCADDIASAVISFPIFNIIDLPKESIIHVACLNNASHNLFRVYSPVLREGAEGNVADSPMSSTGWLSDLETQQSLYMFFCPSTNTLSEKALSLWDDMHTSALIIDSDSDPYQRSKISFHSFLKPHFSLFKDDDESFKTLLFSQG